MPRALVTIAGTCVAAGAGTGVATPATGQTFVPVTSQNDAAIRLAQVYASGAAIDWVRFRSSRLHDVNDGIRLFVGGTLRRPLLPWNAGQLLYQQDAPIVEIDATGATTGGILAQYEYDDYEGVNPALATWAEIQPRIKAIYSKEVDVTSGAAGVWGVGTALNAANDNFKADYTYAILGYTLSVACLGVAFSGAMTGNLLYGGPGDTDPFLTRNYFADMSDKTGRACIPLLNSNNRAATTLQNVDTAAATATKASVIMGWLG